MKEFPKASIATVGFSTGRYYLKVAEIIVAMEGDPFRGELPEAVMPPISAEELEHATIGGESVKDTPIEVVRWFRGDNWTEKMLEYTAEQINTAAAKQIEDIW